MSAIFTRARDFFGNNTAKVRSGTDARHCRTKVLAEANNKTNTPRKWFGAVVIILIAFPTFFYLDSLPASKFASQILPEILENPEFETFSKYSCPLTKTLSVEQWDNTIKISLLSLGRLKTLYVISATAMASTGNAWQPDLFYFDPSGNFEKGTANIRFVILESEKTPCIAGLSISYDNQPKNEWTIYSPSEIWRLVPFKQGRFGPTLHETPAKWP
jgi:hypothetical protein